MSFKRLLQRAAGAPVENRRKTPRVRCRLNCTMRVRRKRIPARVLDVSEGGLCLLSPVPLRQKQVVVLQIEVPPRGPVEVEAVAWNVRQVKGARAGKKTWSIGMMVTNAGDGFQALLPARRGTQICDVAPEVESDAAQVESDAPEVDLSIEAEELSSEWEESAAEWDALFAEAEEQFAEAGDPESEAPLRMFRVRVKATTGPRTRTLTLSAASKSDAMAQAQEALEGSWKILQVEPA